MSKEKRTEKMHDALQYLDDAMIEEVESLRGLAETDANQHVRMKKPWKKYLALAASFCILVAGSWIYHAYIQPDEKIVDVSKQEEQTDTDGLRQQEHTDDAEDSLKAENESSADQTQMGNPSDAAHIESHKNGVYIPKMEVDLKKTEGVEADMLGFIILNGRLYIQYEVQSDYMEKNADFVGEYAGSITGMIDEWTKADGYVNGAGTYTGNVYEVKGISPEFMLCMVWEDGTVETFVNHNDIILYKGSDLVDSWLNLRGNYENVALETIKEEHFVYETLKLTKEEKQVFDQFLDAFAQADYVYVEDIVSHPFGGDYDIDDMLEFYFVKENGVRLRFRTMGDGYIMFPWIDACARIDSDIYDAVVEILMRHTK